MNAQMRAAVAAESVFHYLNSFLDDIARLVPFLLGCEPSTYAWYADRKSDKRIDVFSKLRKLAKKAAADDPLAPVKDLFMMLDETDGWWNQAFAYGYGIRHRLRTIPTYSMFKVWTARDPH